MPESYNLQTGQLIMQFSFNIEAVAGRLPALGTTKNFLSWARGDVTLDKGAKPDRAQFLPMMTARRMCAGSRMAADTGLELLKAGPVEAAVYASRHGELERNYSILSAIAHDSDVSPTDFAMSVHNAASGSFTIAGKCRIPVSSVSAGLGTFPQALCEAYAMLCCYEHVLLVDFDSYIPDFFRLGMDQEISSFPYAAGFVLSRGSDVSCTFTGEKEATAEPELPFSLQFIRALFTATDTLELKDTQGVWTFSGLKAGYAA